MSTLTQAELDDYRRWAERGDVNWSPHTVLALLDHIAQLTAERDETRAENDHMAGILDDRCEELGNAQVRIAELEAHPSAQPSSATIEALTNRFLCWPLPQSVNSDNCVTYNTYKYPRSGTNLLSADEARQMVEYLVAIIPGFASPQPSAQFVAGMRVLKDMVRLQKDIQADVSTAHRLRGSGASEWMREDDRDMRGELDAAFNAARAILAEAALAAREATP